MPFAEMDFNTTYVILMHTVGPDASPKHITIQVQTKMVNNVLKL